MSQQSEETSSEPPWVRLQKAKDNLPFWIDNIDYKISSEVRSFLEEYSHIPPEQVGDHVYATREKAWAIRTYPNTGTGVWLVPLLPLCPVYEQILDRLKDGGTCIDVGCFIGHDLRRLAVDGVPTNKLYGVDIVDHWQLGYEFFNDRNRFQAHFILEDILKPGSGLSALEGQMDVIISSHLLHQFDKETQFAAALRLCALSKPGSLIVGFQCGTRDNNWILNEMVKTVSDKPRYAQTPPSWKAMWEKVGQRTGTEWDCQVEVWSWDDVKWVHNDWKYMGNEVKPLQFVMTRKK